jgi:hypothetical protein
MRDRHGEEKKKKKEKKKKRGQDKGRRDPQYLRRWQSPLPVSRSACVCVCDAGLAREMVV